MILLNHMGKSTTNKDYNASSITVLEGLEPVRKRPGMYIGSTGPEGLHHLVWEIIDNSFDEAMAGFCHNIRLSLLDDGSVKVEDDGRGIPVDINKQYKKSGLELALTKLHAGGKFDNTTYKVSGGLHGVGVSVVNALSVTLKAQVFREGKIWEQEYARGVPTSKLKSVGSTRRTGTTITFIPDSTIFPDTTFAWDTIITHLRQQAYLTQGIRLQLEDRREKNNPHSYSFLFEGGIASYVRHLNIHKSVLHPIPFSASKDAPECQVDIAFQYNDDYKETVLAFANNIYNPEGGTHVVGFRTSLTRSLNQYARAKGYLKEKDENLAGEDVREGLTAVISVKVSNPQFEGQTKSKLGNTEVRTAVETIFSEQLAVYLEEHPKEAEVIIGKCLLTSRARIAARAARDTVLRKGVLEGLTLPGKLADCSSRDPKQTELYIVEGDSAGGCFSGNTTVALADGRAISFKELAEEANQGITNFCYTIRNDGAIGIEEIKNPRLTKKNASVIKILLDNNEEIVCTPDHLFMTRAGKYKKAVDLTAKDSLMPLRKQVSRLGKRITIKGYELVFDPKEHRWIFTHMLSDQWNLGHGVYPIEHGEHRHHADFDKRNNDPTNIIRMSAEGHLQHHRDHVRYTLHRADVIEKCRVLKRTPEFRKKMSERMKEPATKKILSEQAKMQWQNPQYKEFMKKKSLDFYRENKEYREATIKRLNEEQKKYWGHSANKEIQSKRVAEFFQKNPQRRTTLSQDARQQWSNPALLEWRSTRTKAQWTPEFREQRMKAYNNTYFNKTISQLRHIYDAHHAVDVERYNTVRKETNDKTLLRFDTFVQRYFAGDLRSAETAVANYNHKIKRIELLNERMDVYDMEVPNTHNFALASGVFVHNSAKQGRNRNFQAILPLRGKILNVQRARLDKILSNNEVKSLIIAMGTNIGEQFDLTQLRYDRIIIMTDADVDGAHIRTLLLTLFYRYFPEIITTGHLYIAQPPLYRLSRGKEMRYAYTEQEKLKYLADLQAAANAKLKNKATQEQSNKETLGESEEGAVTSVGGVTIQRYKGLGEMNPEQLWQTTMDPVTRTMLQVTVEDAAKADELFEILMGAEVAPRKHFIQVHAKMVKNLDI